MQLKVLLAQVPVADGDVDRNLQTLVATLAKHPDADLAVFPEMFLPGYDTAGLAGRALSADSRILRDLSDAARRHDTAVVVGYAEAAGGAINNALACVDRDGHRAGTYRATHLFGERETRAFQPGAEYLIVELAGVHVGPQLCFDTEFPEPARAMAADGADLLVTAAANMAPYGHDHRIATAARAAENHLPHVYVNRTGARQDFTFLGASAALDARGQALLRLGDQPETAVAVVPIDEAPSGDVDYLKHLNTTGPLPVRYASRAGTLLAD